MAMNSKAIEEKFAELEALVNKQSYEYCLCFDENMGGILRRDRKTNTIEQEYDEDIAIGNNPFVILFPEMLVYDLTHGDELESLNAFDKWYLQKAFNTTNDEILMKRVRKLQRQWDREEEERRAGIEARHPTKAGPMPIDKPIETKPMESKPEPIEPTESSVQRIRRISSQIAEDFNTERMFR